MSHRTASLGRATALACLALMCGSARAADNRLSAQEKAAGWLLLFDGRTFAGWEDPSKKSPPGDSFVIVDGCLKATARPRIAEDLFTRDTYRDFELEFDWRIAPGGNSGVKYRIQDRVVLLSGNFPRFEDQVNASLKQRSADRLAKGTEYVIAFEYQVLDNTLNPDAKNGTTHQAGALYDVAAPSKDATRPVGEFNRSRIVVQGDLFEHWLNGVKVVAASLSGPEVAASAARRWGVGSPVYELLAKQPRRDCQISLQNHNSEAWFRNIRIRRLK